MVTSARGWIEVVGRLLEVREHTFVLLARDFNKQIEVPKVVEGLGEWSTAQSGDAITIRVMADYAERNGLFSSGPMKLSHGGGVITG